MKQNIEVEYNNDLVEKYKNNYIMEEEGIGEEEAKPYDEQTTFNNDTLKEMLDESTVVEYED